MSLRRAPKVYQLTLTNGDSELCDFVEDYGKVAKFCELINFDDTNDLSVMLNEDPEAVFTLAAGTAQVFNGGGSSAITITSVRVSNANSGADSTYCEIIISI